MMKFKRLLEECLERIRQGDSVQSCLDANVEDAAQLQPHLASAAVFRGLRVPVVGTGKAVARQRLMQSVAAGTGKEEPVFGVMKFAHVAGAFVGALFLMSVGLVTASGIGGIDSPFGGGGEDHDEILELKGEVLEVSDDRLTIAKGDHEIEFVVSEDTVFKDENGHEIDGVQQGDFVIVLAKKDGDVFVAVKVRLLDEDMVHKPDATPKPSATPKPDAIPVPEATPVLPVDEPPPAEPQPASAVFEGWVKELGDGSFLLKQADATKITIHFNGETVIDGHLSVGAAVRVEASVYPDGSIVATRITVTQTEFWGVVVSIGSGHMIVNTEFGQVKVLFGEQTQWSGDPFPGVKVIIAAVKNADGTYSAKYITVKMAEFSGPIAWLEGAAMGVSAWDTTLTVKWNGATAWQGPDPHVGGQVSVFAYKMGDGTFLAKQIVVKPESFQGTVVSHSPGEFTIQVQVEAQVREVCYEFADVIGTLAVGKLVLVEVDHVDASTYFASLVKVLN